MLDQWYQNLGLSLEPMELILLAGLVLARSMPLLFLNPFLGGKLVPGVVKMATAATFVILLLPSLSQAPAALPGGFGYAVLLAKEASIGATLGFVSGLVFLAFSSAGRLIDTQRGTNMAETMFYQLGERTSVMGQFYSQTAIVLFLIVGGHLIFLRAYFQSFELLPVWDFPVLAQGSTPLAREIIRMTADFWVIALQLAAPALIALFMTDIGFGIINRASPQINVFVTSQPAKVAVGVFMVLLTLHVLFEEFQGHTRNMLIDLYRFVGYLGS